MRIRSLASIAPAGRDRDQQHASVHDGGDRATPSRAPDARRSLLDHWLAPVLLGVAGVLTVLGLWELSVSGGLLAKEDVPPPSEVLPELFRQGQSRDFWSALGQTAKGAGIGLGIAVLIAVPVGTLMAANKYADKALHRIVEFFRAVPGISLVPLAILLWGPTSKSDIFLVAFGCTWPLLVQVFYGVANVDRLALDTARAFGLGRLAQVRHVVVPAALPYFATGMRICCSVALIIAVSVELFVGTPGLGASIRQAQDSLALDRMYALIVASGIAGVVVFIVTSRLERYFLHWHVSQRQRGTA